MNRVIDYQVTVLSNPITDVPQVKAWLIFNAPLNESQRRSLREQLRDIVLRYIEE